ncbi:MAG TPA: hypothetical protein VM686_25255 [Polyangiaceae bacterium]|nr:hypothetical protein [Polyangiaceae bacterium]
MNPSSRIDRKKFLTWTLGSGSAWVLGCSDPVDTVRGDDPSAGTGGGGTGGGTAGTTSSGGSSGGSAAGTGGTSAGTSGAGGSSAGTSGAGGSSAGTAGTGGTTPVNADCSAQLQVTISADHGHVLAVTLEHVMAGVPMSYDTTGTSMHPHWIQLTAEDFATLQSGGTVRKLSCNDGHEHEFMIACTGVAPTPTSGITAHCDPEHACGEADGTFCPALP